MSPSPKFARACGRVSIGRHPDKRPDSRLKVCELKTSLRDRQPEAKPAHPALNGGWAFLVSLVVQRSAPKRLVHLAGRAEWVLPLQTKAAVPAQEPRALTVSPTHGWSQALRVVYASRTRKNAGG